MKQTPRCIRTSTYLLLLASVGREAIETPIAHCLRHDFPTTYLELRLAIILRRVDERLICCCQETKHS